MSNTVNRINDAMTKEQFAASFIKALKHGAQIVTGNEKAAGDARELMNRLRAETEEDMCERR